MDIRTTWSPGEILGDWLLSGNVLDNSLDLPTAYLIAIFTDKTAYEDDLIPNGSDDRRGWWGDLDAEELFEGWNIGSRLWLVDREKQTEEVRARVEHIILEAVQPFIDKRIVSRHEIEVSWIGFQQLGVHLIAYRGQEMAVDLRFDDLWNQLKEWSAGRGS